MSFGAPQAPQEDPAVRTARLREEDQANADLTSQIQTDLRRRTLSRLQRFGFAPNAPSTSIAPPAQASFLQNRLALPGMLNFFQRAGG